jgi:phospholipid N-methyltransferase
VSAFLPEVSLSKDALRTRIAFLRTFLHDPRQVGSLAPSFHYLGDAMREMVEALSGEPLTIVVLGVGTGAVASSFKGHSLYGFDLSLPLLDLARDRLPDATLSRADVLAESFSLDQLPQDRPIALVSCIPVVNLTARQRALYEAKVDGFLDDPRVLCFLQYSYLPRPPLRIPRSCRRQRWVLRNLPPAGVHLWRRMPESEGAALKAA